jgi:RimJ/RimL family protein N-acetyltransferase
LPAYEDALVRGWSPRSHRDVSRKQLRQLRQLRHDPKRFLYELYYSPMVRLSGDREVARLPTHEFWISDGEFCGQIRFHFQRGYPTQALHLMLPICHSEGFARVLIICDDDNEGSQKVILANGGIPAGTRPHATRRGHVRLMFRVATTPECRSEQKGLEAVEPISVVDDPGISD